MLKSTTLGCYFLKNNREKWEGTHSANFDEKVHKPLALFFCVCIVFAPGRKNKSWRKKNTWYASLFFFSAWFAFFTQALTILADIRKVRPYVRIGAKIILFFYTYLMNLNNSINALWLFVFWGSLRDLYGYMKTI